MQPHSTRQKKKLRKEWKGMESRTHYLSLKRCEEN